MYEKFLADHREVVESFATRGIDLANVIPRIAKHLPTDTKQFEALLYPDGQRLLAADIAENDPGLAQQIRNKGTHLIAIIPLIVPLLRKYIVQKQEPVADVGKPAFIETSEESNG